MYWIETAADREFMKKFKELINRGITTSATLAEGNKLHLQFLTPTPLIEFPDSMFHLFFSLPNRPMKIISSTAVLSLHTLLAPGRNFDIDACFPNHTQEKTRPTLHKVVNVLACRYVVNFTFENIIKVAIVAVSYPSLPKIPEDLEAHVLYILFVLHQSDLM